MINRLAQRQLQLVLTYAPAGLGHLRVMDALYHGLPETTNPVVLAAMINPSRQSTGEQALILCWKRVWVAPVRAPFVLFEQAIPGVSALKHQPCL